MLDTENLYTTCLVKTATRLNVPIDSSVAHSLVGLSAGESRSILVNYLGSNVTFESLEEETYKAFYEALNKRTPVKREARDFLSELCSQEIPFAIVTNTKTADAKGRIENSDIGDLVGAVFGSDIVKNPKPAPDLYEFAARQLEVSPDSCLAIEDSTAGVTAALGAGCDVAHIPDIAPIPEELSSQCRYFTTSLSLLSVELRALGTKMADSTL